MRASAYDETFVPRTVDDWLEQLAAGKTYVNEDFEEDDYGTFLTALAPIYDAEGRYSGFAGVDFDTEYYLMREARFRAIAIATLGAALLLALRSAMRQPSITGHCSGACASFMTLNPRQLDGNVQPPGRH